MYLVASRETSCGLICSLKEFSTKPICIVIDVHCTCVPFYGQKMEYVIPISNLRRFLLLLNAPYSKLHTCTTVTVTTAKRFNSSVKIQDTIDSRSTNFSHSRYRDNALWIHRSHGVVKSRKKCNF